MRTPALALALALALTWFASGTSFLAMKVASRELTPMAIAVLRLVGGGLMLSGPLIWRLRDPSNRPTPNQLRSAAVAGITMMAVGQPLLLVGVSLLPAGIAAVFGSASPLMLAIFAWAFLGQPLGRTQLSGIGLGAAGLVLMGWSSYKGGDFTLAGVAAMLASAAAWAAGSLYSRRADLPRDPVVSIAVQTLIAGIAVTLAVPLIGDVLGDDLTRTTFSTWLTIGYLILVGTTLFAAFSWLNLNVSSAVANTFTYAAPVIALGLAALILDESVTAGKVAAATTALAGVALIVSGPSSGSRKVASRA